MIKRIVLTGGPGSGKTTVIESIKKNFGGKYKVIVVDETASYLINMGIRPFGNDKIPMIDFQELVLKTQLAKEDIIETSLKYLKNEDILIIYDRGLLDNCAYITKEEFEEVLSRLDKRYTINEFLERYNLVINLVSKKDFYTTENNPARSEKLEDALELGNKTLFSWLGHNNLKIVYPKEDLNEKIKEVLNYINNILKEYEVKYQEKYLIDINKSDIKKIKSISKLAHINQTYLESDNSIEKRIRKNTMDGHTTYTYTIYKTLKNNKKVKVSEESINKRIYEKLIDFKDKSKETISKDRYFFPYEDQYFTLDIYDNYGILEINISDLRKTNLPPFIEVIEDVTNKDEYQNINLANKISKQFTKK